MYGVSRITVRQALKDLEHLGHLQSRPGKGI
ncbi:MAG: GntR family transcriptional regulator [Shinella sp.]|nr:GntR family transcriptional regulator [Shinella sp.]MDX3978594.1 GntR family transcriptional regulator [Shinella sp.]